MNPRPSPPKYARNKNMLVIGGSGSGKLIKGTKVTAKTLAKAMTLVLRQIKKAQDGSGKTSIKKLAKSGALQNVEISDNNIKSFDPIARKNPLRSGKG